MAGRCRRRRCQTTFPGPDALGMAVTARGGEVAGVESSWEPLKRECLQGRVFATRADARRTVSAGSTGTTRPGCAPASTAPQPSSDITIRPPNGEMAIVQFAWVAARRLLSRLRDGGAGARGDDDPAGDAIRLQSASSESLTEGRRADIGGAMEMVEILSCRPAMPGYDIVDPQVPLPR